MNGSSQANVEHAVLHPANDRAQIDRAESVILGSLDKFGYPDASKFAVRLALEEALVNAFQHGHRGLPETETVDLEYSVSPTEVTIAVTDRGPGFDPGAVPDPTSEGNLELPSGRGLMLMRAFMTTVEHDMGGKRLRMTYKFPAEA
jgi:serine/threonine-protein kinase RsbW